MSRLFEQLVRQRGFSVDYIKPRYEALPDPFLLPEMRKAVERVKLAKERGEKVMIYGDYDVDGVTASTLMKEVLTQAGVREVEVMLPDRFRDGYGMSKKVVQRAKEAGVGLILTVDCGSANKEIIGELEEAGVDVVVTDHHECPEELPKAVAVVNPKRRDAYKMVVDFEEHAEELLELRDLAGVGVAFMMARALVMEGLIKEGQEKWLLDLVLIGTICDSMKMTKTNRILCFYGVKVLGKTRRVGIKELFRATGTNKITAETIGFQVGPRLNAAGRMASAEKALRLLMATSRSEAAQLAGELEKLNEERRAQQNAAMEEFRERGVVKEPVLVATGDWHEGVLGIIAGKLVEEYKRPAFVLTKKDGIYKGSGRSFGEFNLSEALKYCQGEIVGGGGHAGAAGVKVEEGKLEKFKQKINEFYRSLGLRDQERFFDVMADLEVRGVGELSLDFMEELKTLEPFGVGNEIPVFKLRDMFVVDSKTMGAEGQHVRMLVRGDDKRMMKLVAFNAPERWRKFEQGREANLLINLEENEWNGLRSVEGRILDLRGCEV